MCMFMCMCDGRCIVVVAPSLQKATCRRMCRWLLRDTELLGVFHDYDRSARGRFSLAAFIALAHSAFDAVSEPCHRLSGTTSGRYGTVVCWSCGLSTRCCSKRCRLLGVVACQCNGVLVLSCVCVDFSGRSAWGQHVADQQCVVCHSCTCICVGVVSWDSIAACALLLRRCCQRAPPALCPVDCLLARCTLS
jgi:hypothetical protein